MIETLHLATEVCEVLTPATECLIMAEEQVTFEQEAPRLSKNAKRVALSFVFFCIIASVVLFAVVAISRRDCPDCKQRSTMLVPVMAILATLLFFLGISILTAFCRRRKSSLTRSPRVVISSISSVDLEKSPVPTLPYQQVSYRQPAFVVKTSPLDSVPDYFTVNQNTGELYSSLHAAAWPEDILEIQPPCYEEAVAMAAFKSATEDRDQVMQGR